MKKLFSTFSLLFFCAYIFAQKDSIFLSVVVSNDLSELEVSEEIVFKNDSKDSIRSIHILNWAAAYQKRNSPLYKRLLEDRNTAMHFAKSKDLGGISDISLTFDGGKALQLSEESNENLEIVLPNYLKPNDAVKLSLRYKIALPNQKFTGYGKDKEELNLKYFFLVPDTFYQNSTFNRNFKNMEEKQSFDVFWKFLFSIPNTYHIASNLPKNKEGNFEGTLETDPEFVIAKTTFPSIQFSIDSQETEVVFGYTLTPKELQDLQFYIPLQLSFIKKYTGLLPPKIFISKKSKNLLDFFGNDDIVFWKFRLKLFSESENRDLDYFGVITNAVLDGLLSVEKEKDHWLTNGLKSFLEMEYLKQNYRDKKLLGDLTDFSIFGIKPLRFFHISKLKLLDRYAMAYEYIRTQNLDQKIETPFSLLSNYNQMAVSTFEMGTLFNYSANKMGKEKLISLLKNEIRAHLNKKFDSELFLNKIAAKDPSLSYLSTIIKKQNNVNFSLKKYRKFADSMQIYVHKNTDAAIPFLVETQNKRGDKTSFWVETTKDKDIAPFSLPIAGVEKISINPEYAFPESNFSDNFLYTKGIFANMRKLKIKLIKDIPNPEYNELYLNPKIRFTNTYDQFLLGLNFRNQALFDRKFGYSITPYYSSGTGKFTGSGAVSYSFLPKDSFFRSISLGLSGSYFHYDFDLAYRKGGIYTNFNFAKNPRSTESSGIGISYNYFQRDLSAQMISRDEYGQYSLLGIGGYYIDNQSIHEKSIGIGVQHMMDYDKLTAEAFYRWEFAPKRKISFRFFGGYFSRNNTRNSTFDYGISRVSNYAFSYNLLGESASSGLLSQQFVLADGAFKSFLPGTVNHWITAFNVDTSVWKIFSVYADAGLYKNKNTDAKFIWDSGVKLRLVPDFLEVFFPIQSTLGFEPSFKDYGKRIRYTLILNLGTIINAARRGWY